MHGIVFDDQSKVIKDLKNLCYDPVPRGRRFLAAHKKSLVSVTSNSIELSEVLPGLHFLDTQANRSLMQNLSQLLILGATGDR
jgi:hypothetical protein